MSPAPPVESEVPLRSVELTEPALNVAREALGAELGGPAQIGEYLGAVAEDEVAVTASFVATEKGYVGWRWSVTLAVLDPDAPTVSEVVLLPGSEALVAPVWVPWSERVRPEDLGVGDLLPTAPNDPRLVPAYLQSDDPAVEAVAAEVGLGRVRVMSRDGRIDLAESWYEGPFGPSSETAQHAPAHCHSCGFYLPLAGSLGVEFGACGNEKSPAQGRVVDVEFGCGAHSEVLLDMPMRSAAADSVIDELMLEVHPREEPADLAPADEP